MSCEARKSLIAKLEAIRDSKVITYITSTRSNLESMMSMDVIQPVFEQLVSVSKSKKIPRIDLFIHSNGGESTVPWRLVTLIREYCDEFNVLVPNRAFSAATLTALGADNVLMHPMGMLGPTDPTVSNPFNPQNPLQPNTLLGISVEDVTSYFELVKEDVGIRHEDELIQAFSILAEKVHPLALGNVKRSNLQSRMMGKKLLSRRAIDGLTEHDIEQIVQKLTSELYFHGPPINRQEAREDVGLTFVQDAPDDVAEEMWNLFLSYDEEMKLSQPFLWVQDAISLNPLTVPVPLAGIGVPNSQALVRLPTLKSVIVESEVLRHSYELEFEVNLTRDGAGTYNGNLILLKQSWIKKP